MNLSKGESAKKEHLSAGARTACNLRTSGIGSNSFDSFKWTYENYPGHCCQKCLNEFLRRLNKKK